MTKNKLAKIARAQAEANGISPQAALPDDFDPYAMAENSVTSPEQAVTFTPSTLQRLGKSATMNHAVSYPYSERLDGSGGSSVRV